MKGERKEANRNRRQTNECDSTYPPMRLYSSNVFVTIVTIVGRGRAEANQYDTHPQEQAVKRGMSIVSSLLANSLPVLPVAAVFSGGELHRNRWPSGHVYASPR